MVRGHKTVAAWLTAVLSLSVLGWTTALAEDQPIKTGVFAGGNDARFSLASVGEEEAVDVPVVEGIRGIKPPRTRRLPGFRRAKPTVIEDQDALSKTFGDAAARKISGQVDLDQQVLVLFQWAGSGQDKLTYAVQNEDDEAKVIFKFKAGRTRDLRPHAHLYAIRKGVAWSIAK